MLKSIDLGGLLDPGGGVGAGLSDLEHPCMQPKINIEAALKPTFSMKSFLSIVLTFIKQQRLGIINIEYNNG
jgi:hypothetical protein